jgi:drug/metabolite transporter (DMT)-like permease
MFRMFYSNLALGELAALAAALSWTLAAIIYTSVGKRIGALAMSLIRIAIACALLMIYERITRGLWLPTDIGVRAWILLGTSGFVWFFLSDLCLLKAYLLIGPRLSLLIMSLTPPMAAALSWICVGDQLALVRWMGMAVTLGGVALVLLEQPHRTDRPGAKGQSRRGILLALLAAALQAIAFLLSKAGVGVCGAMAATLIAMLGALLGHIVLVTLWRRWPAMVAATCNGQILLILACAATIGPFIGVVLSMTALHYAPTGVVSTIIATMPILILPFSIFLYRERISLRAVVGAVVAIAGVALLSVPC